MTIDEKLSEKLTSGALRRDDVALILRWQLSLPAERLDCALVAACARALTPEQAQGEGLRALHDALMEKIRKRPAYKRRALRTLIAAALLLAALAACAAAYGVARGVLRFNEDLPDGPRMTAHEGAQALVAAGVLARASLAHCTVEVREAAYDGGELRVMYAVTSKTGAAREEDGTLSGAARDGVHPCDYIIIDGQTAYLDETYEAAGDDGQSTLYYLRTTPGAWGVDVGQTLAVGLPLLPRAGGEQPTLDFTLATDAAQSAARGAALLSADEAVRLERAAFSPLRGEVMLFVEGMDADALGGALDGRVYAEDGEGEALVARYAGRLRDAPGGVRLTVEIDPPGEAWPEAVALTLLRRDGPREGTITLALE